MFKTAPFILLTLLSGDALSQMASQDSPRDWLNFNASQQGIPADASGWFHREPGAAGCAGWNPTQSALCKGDQARLHWYYNNYNSDHMGWLRQGTIAATDERAITGSALDLWVTGGATRDTVTQEIVHHGSPVVSLQQLNAIETHPKKGDYSDIPLPGSVSIYYKNTGSTTPISDFSGVNRLTQWVWLPADPDRRARYSRKNKSVARPDKTIAWYPFLDSSKGGHYYHHITNRASGGWVFAQWDAHPTHHNGGPYAEYHAFTEGGRDAPLNGQDYFSRITAFSMVYHVAGYKNSPYRVTTDDWSVFYQPDENEETINNLAVGYDPEFRDFDISFEDKYRCADCKARYEIWFSFKPITLATLSNAEQVMKVENFFIEDDNTSGLIIKPNTYYNQIWARFSLPDIAMQTHISGQPLYFAVRDVTDRGAIASSEDHDLIDLPDGSMAKRTDLLKTIKYTYQPNIAAPAIIAEQQYRTTSGDTLTIPLSSTLWQSGWTWHIENNPDISSALSANNASSVTLNVSGYAVGEHLLSVRLRDSTGKTLARHTFTLIARKADCRQLSNCPHYTLVSYGSSATTHDFPSPQWHTVIRDIYTNAVAEGGMGIVVGSNGSYQSAGIKGDTFIVGTHDVITFTVKNSTPQQINVAPRVSLTSDQRVAVSPESWFSLESRTIEPGEKMQFEIPASSLPTSKFNLININLPVNSQGVLLKDIAIYTDKAMLCNGCGASLIDFYHNNGAHLTPYADWQTPLKDIYTGVVGERGSGIIIGANGSYNYQGVRGSLPLPPSANHIILRWRSHASETLRFRPKVSFNDPDRPISGEVGDWILSEEVVLLPGQTAMQYIPIPEGEYFMVNVSVNYNQSGLISLTKISMD